MGKFMSFISGAVLGAVMGGAIALMMTPKSGEATRAGVKHEIDSILAEGRRAAQSRRAELEAQLSQMRGEAPPRT